MDRPGVGHRVSRIGREALGISLPADGRLAVHRDLDLPGSDEAPYLGGLSVLEEPALPSAFVPGEFLPVKLLQPTEAALGGAGFQDNDEPASLKREADHDLVAPLDPDGLHLHDVLGGRLVRDLDDAAAALKVAEANLALARARYAKTQIVAPFDGIIGARKVSIGTFLRAGQGIADLANIDAIRVNFSAPERFLSRLSQGAEVAVSTTAFPGHELKGKIIVIEPVLDPATRSARTRRGG